MQLNDIITQLVESGELERVCRHILSGKSLQSQTWKDLQQDICMFLLEYEYPNTLIEMHNRGQLVYWITKVADYKTKPNDSFFRENIAYQYNQQEITDAILNIADDRADYEPVI